MKTTRFKADDKKLFILVAIMYFRQLLEENKKRLISRVGEDYY